MKRTVIQILNFVIIGGFTTLVDLCVLIFTTERLNIPYFISNLLSFSISLSINYFLSMRFVFVVNNRQSKKDGLMFAVLSILGLVLNQSILVILTHYFGLFYVYSKIIAIFVVMVWNFVSKKLYFERRSI